jgi:hypothetical protein
MKAAYAKGVATWQSKCVLLVGITTILAYVNWGYNSIGCILKET